MKLAFSTITKDKIINIIIVIIAFIIVIYIYRFQSKNIHSLKTEKDMEIRKNEVLDNIRQSEKIINSYQNLFSKRDTSLLLSTISNIANESGVAIISMKPAAEEQFPLYIKYSFNLVISVNNYHAIGTFISNLESHPDVYFVDQVSFKPVERSEKSDQPARLIVDLTLSTILLKG